MNMISKLAVLGLFLGLSSQLRAEALDGYVGISGGMIKHMTPSDQSTGDSRYGVRLDFVRIQKSVALDFRFGNGAKYQDMGGALKVFHHFAFSNSTATGLSVGTGIGAMYSRAGLDGSGVSFNEVFMPVFGRVMFDVGLGFGIFIDAEYNAMFKRKFSETSTAASKDIASRYYMGVGLAILAM